MSTSPGRSLTFSPYKGVNVELSNSKATATWTPHHSWGWAFSESPLVPGNEVTLRVTGSGHCQVGFTTIDPVTMVVKSTASSCPDFTYLTVIKCHKVESRCCLSLDKKGRKVLLRHESQSPGTDETSQKVAPNTKVWLAVVIQFGQLSVVFSDRVTQLLKWSTRHGPNIRLTEDGTNRAIVALKNPGSICFVRKAIQVGEQVTVQIVPLASDTGRPPGQCHVIIYMYDADPATLTTRAYTHLFTSEYGSQIPQSRTPFTEIVNLDKKVCMDRDATIISFPDHSSVCISNTREGYHKQCTLPSNIRGQGRLWLVFEVYRVSLDLVRKDESARSWSRGIDATDGCVSHYDNLHRNKATVPMEHTYMDMNSYQYDRPYTNLERIRQLEKDQSECEQTLRKHIYNGFPLPQSLSAKQGANAENIPGHAETKEDDKRGELAQQRDVGSQKKVSSIRLGLKPKTALLQTRTGNRELQHDLNIDSTLTTVKPPTGFKHIHGQTSKVASQEQTFVKYFMKPTGMVSQARTNDLNRSVTQGQQVRNLQQATVANGQSVSHGADACNEQFLPQNTGRSSSPALDEELRLATLESRMDDITSQLQHFNINPQRHVTFKEDNSSKVKDSGQWQGNSVTHDNVIRIKNLEKRLGFLLFSLTSMVEGRHGSERLTRNDLDLDSDLDPIINCRAHYVTLINDLDPIGLSDHLYQDEMISETDMKKVQYQGQTPNEANKILMDIMKLKCIRKSQLTPVLLKIGQGHLITQLFPK